VTPNVNDASSQEARSASALNHPNIITIYDMGNQDGLDFIVMEHVSGKTLDERIPRKGMKLNEALKVAIQTADALAKAHSAGIVHRDLKPTNVMVTEDGLVKVLDFGLAKLTEVGSDEGGTATTLLKTEEGTVVGTTSYMSPEQAEGKPVDARSDIFSFGAVLYEMVTGQKAFQGETKLMTLAAIANREPKSISELVSDAPRDLEKIVNRCLRKDPARRFHYMQDLKVELEELKEDSDSGKLAGMSPPVRTTPQTWAWAGTPVVVLTLAATLWLLRYTGKVPSSSEVELKQRQLTTNSSETPVTAAAISPKGKYLAYSDKTGIFLKLIDSGERHSLGVPTRLRVSNLAWFPDGTKLLATGTVENEKNSSAWTPSILGGSPVKIRDDVGTASVSPDGSLIAFVSGGKEVWLMSANGEEPRRLLPGDGNSTLRSLVWFPSGQRLGYIRVSFEDDMMNVESCDLQGRAGAVGLPKLSQTDIAALPDGKIIYSTARSPWTLSGDPETDRAPLKQSEGSLWKIAMGGLTGSIVGKPKRIISWPGFVLASSLSASRDGKRLVLVKESSDAEIYVGELEENGRRMKPPKRLTFDDHYDFPSGWTADSKAVLFSSDRNGSADIFKQALDQQLAEPIVAGPGNEFDPTLTPDGASLLYFALHTSARMASGEPVSLRRAPIAGGPPQLVLNERGFSIVHCAKHPSDLCVVDQRNQKQLVLYAFDPSRGKGRELMRIDLGSTTASYLWDLSPDGSRIAVVYGEHKDRIRILPLNGGAASEVTVDGWSELDGPGWAADGKSLFVTASSAGSDVLLHVDLEGHAHMLWKQPSSLGGIYGVPSPDGKYVAFPVGANASNAWLIENPEVTDRGKE
jgi:eukaryotic-like serine/threonine-protein kinase